MKNKLKYVILFIFFSVQNSYALMLDDIEYEKEEKNYFFIYSKGTQNESLKSYKENIGYFDQLYPSWEVRPFADQVNTGQFDLGYGIGNSAIMLGYGFFDTNKSKFYLDNYEEGYNTISARFIRITYRSYLVDDFWAQVKSRDSSRKNLFFPFVEVGAGFYFIDWYYESTYMQWHNSLTGQILNPLKGETDAFGGHCSIGLSFMLTSVMFIEFKYMYVYAGTDKLKTGASDPQGYMYWNYAERKKVAIDLSGTSSLMQIGIMW